MAEAIFQKPLNKRIKRLIDGLTYQAVKSGNNWILPSGTNAAAGEYITVDGVLGQATAAIVGGTDAIVEGTNWAPEGVGGVINALNSKLTWLDIQTKNWASGTKDFTIPNGATEMFVQVEGYNRSRCFSSWFDISERATGKNYITYTRAASTAFASIAFSVQSDLITLRAAIGSDSQWDNYYVIVKFR